MKIFQGASTGLELPFIARVDCIKTDERGVSYLVSGKNKPALLRTGSPVIGLSTVGGWYRFENIDIDMGDIVTIQDNGQLHVAISSNSTENSLLLTDRCNHHCIMCAQPKKGVGGVFYDEAIDIVELMDFQPVALGLTGGEPLLYKEQFLEFLKFASTRLPDTYFQLLTNGTMLNDYDYVKKINQINSDINYCIPLYADNEVDHNMIVGNKQAFWKTMNGLSNLARHNSNIEIRNVLFSKNISRIAEYAEFICKNIPFVSHVALMGIEMVGKASTHHDFYIFNHEWHKSLDEAACALYLSKINFSFYNIPLCVIPKSLHEFCRKSISPWKIRHIARCSGCDFKDECCGIFFSNVEFHQHPATI